MGVTIKGRKVCVHRQRTGQHKNLVLLFLCMCLQALPSFKMKPYQLAQLSVVLPGTLVNLTSTANHMPDHPPSLNLFTSSL
uniref:Uncharacterized protein n=1 Tax=Rhipicephalus appendiculatus TaxID=34631 RepID=A0A131YDQ2_RHIAP